MIKNYLNFIKKLINLQLMIDLSLILINDRICSNLIN